MQKLMGLFIFLSVLFLCQGPSFAGTEGNDGFNEMKSLVGEWQGKAENGKSVHASYKLVSRGTALVETLNPADESEMITVYYPDGKSLMMTHYCDGNNQPRMRAVPSAISAKQITFNFVDITNLPSPTTGHMRNLVVQFEDNNHFTQRWSWRENSKEGTEVFHFTRQN